MHEQVAIDKPFCRLLRFKRFTDDLPTLQRLKPQPTVLVVAPLSGHHATLLRDTVRELLPDHKVLRHRLDRRAHGAASTTGPFHLDDYVAYVQEFIRHLGPDVHVISVCQPTVPVLAAVSLMASAGETDAAHHDDDGRPDRRRARARPRSTTSPRTRAIAWFENNVIHRVPVNYPGAGRRVYPGFLQHAGFIAMNPDRHLKSHYDYFLDLVRGDGDKRRGHRDFYDEYNAVLDMPAEYYLDTIKTVFQDFALRNGTWEVRRRAGAPAGHHDDRAADDRRRARRHLRRRPDRGGARPVHRHARRRDSFHYDAHGRRPLRHLLRPALARDRSTRRCATSSPRISGPASRGKARKPARGASVADASRA